MTNVHLLIQQLQRQSVTQLKQTYAATSGENARSNNREWLVKKIVWCTQAAELGGLSHRARARATELARDQDLRVRPRQAIHDAAKAATAPTAAPTATATMAPRGLPPVGSVIAKTYRGRRLEVQVVGDGFVFEHEHFKSLSAIARHITGANWNGKLFFGLKER